MKVFISYSHQDRAAVNKIADRLRADGHNVWLDSLRLRAGDNIEKKTSEGLVEADALILVVSENSFRSKWVQYEFSAIALQQISGREKTIIPVKLDESNVPSYLANRLYLDLSKDFEAGLERLSADLLRPEEASVAPSPVGVAQDVRSRHLQNLRETLRKGRLTLVCGAGVSIEAGVPSWRELLIRLLKAMMERISKNYSLKIDGKSAAEFEQRHGASSLILGKYLKNNLGRDFPKEVRDALYASPTGQSKLIDSIVGLARPQRDGRPLDSIITFNFDSLIEESLTENKVPNKPIFSEAIAHEFNQIPIYHVHGFLPRTGRVNETSGLVFSEDAYHSQFIDPFSWSNLIQLNKFTTNTCLLVGISLTDPNMRRLLDVAWRKNPEKVMSHFIVKKLPRFSDGDVLDDVAKLLEEQDANALGLNVIWIEEFSEVASVLSDVSFANE